MINTNTTNDASISETIETNELEKEEKTEQENSISEETQNVKNDSSTQVQTSNTKTNNNNNNTKTNTNVNNNNNNNSNNSNNNNNSTSNNTTVESNEKKINVKLSSGKTITIPLEEYVIGVVGAEMPAEFHIEALKAQAVASRTYALKKTLSGGAISASTSDQTFYTTDQLKSQWGSSFNKYYEKVKNAVNATKGQTIKYNGSYIEALFFSTSNGKTEASENVWGNSYPYLKSVDSQWDTSVRSFSSTKTISIDEVSKKLGVNLTSLSQIKVINKTIGDRVGNISICDKVFTGVKIRQLLGLRSADFEISQDGNNLIFTTKGYGHGVGMSQYGSNGMAKSGYSYQQILKHYYTNVTIS